MLNMAKRQILPASVRYSGRLADAVKAIGAVGTDAGTQAKMLEKVCGLIDSLHQGIESLEDSVAKVGAIEDYSARAEGCRDSVVPAMQSLRESADELEMVVDADLWPIPTYTKMLFSR